MRDPGHGTSAAWRPPIPRRTSPVPTWILLTLSLLVTLSWWTFERVSTSAVHPRHAEMVRAARTMRDGMAAIHASKQARGILADADVDPNATGLIGPEWSPLVTTYGDLVAKRTATNPDLAASLVAELTRLGADAGDTIVVVMSGSLVGANVAILSAAHALDYRVLAVSSLGASMWGATDPDFTWLDMEATLRQAGVLDVTSRLAVLGGDMALGGGIPEPGVAALRASARRHDVPLWEPTSLEELTDRVFAHVARRTDDLADVRAFVNVGGSMLSLGLCREAASYPVGMSSRSLPCRDGTPGLMTVLSRRDVPVLHVLNLDELAIRYGLPLDPRPLPNPGENPRVYGGGTP